MAEPLSPDHPCFDPDDPKGAHDWKFHPDWYGDPGVINGTADCSYWRCEVCGEENYEMEPPSYDEDY